LPSRDKLAACRYDGAMPDPLDWLNDALADLDKRALRRTRAARQSPQRGDQIEIDGQSLVNFGSNDYLGLAADPRIVEAVRASLDDAGWGAGASPLVTGRSELHAALEVEIARFEGAQAALLFPTGYAANVGAIASLVGKGDAVYSDALNHASLIDGCRLSGATIHVYRHHDLDHLQELLRQSPPPRRRLIVTESLFSMDGDFAPLPALVETAQSFNAMLLVDEAHATGIFGKQGRGLCEQDGVESKVAVRVGTLSKALGSMGGFVAGSQRLIDWLVNRARPYIFSTAGPSAAAAAGLQALQVVQHDPERRQTLLQLAGKLRTQLVAAGISRPTSQGQIVPVILGDPQRALGAAAALRRQGFFVPAIRPPSVPEGQSLLRISVTALHTDQQIDDLVAALAKLTG
jgi:8-amino-7-oxononanoate synthase